MKEILKTISPSMVSKITDKVIGAATAWQNRMLDKIYPIVYMDAMHFKVRDDNRIVSKAAYICMAYDISGYKDILGITLAQLTIEFNDKLNKILN